MKRVLCFGDSNTWGYDPDSGERLQEGKRWTGILDRNTGPNYRIIEEGLNGRTTVWNDPIEGVSSGLNHLEPCLDAHKPVDLVILMLGTNDLKFRFSSTAYDIAEGMGRLVDLIDSSDAGRGEESPATLVVSPPPIGELSEFEEMFRGAREKSGNLSNQFCRVAEEKGCYFLDAGDFVSSSDVDGIHLAESEHKKLGGAIADKISALDI